MTVPAQASVAVAVAQFAPTADWVANLEVMEALVTKAVSRGARLVLFPEYASHFIDPFDESLARAAQDIDGPFVDGLRDMAARHGIVVVAGLLERGEGKRVRNAMVAVDRAGVLARYRKLHLYDAFGHRESDWVEPGAIAAPETFAFDGLRFGLMTCYDLRFPEVTRVLVDAEVDVVLVAAEWVRGPLKELHWRTLLLARAIENTVFVAAADHPPPLGVGNSMIVDPQGVQLATLGTTTDVAVAYLERSAIEQVRRVNPALGLRRFRVQPRG